MGILDKAFRYVPAASSDIRKTFAAWNRDYAKMWNEAHAENESRSQPVRAVVTKIVQRGGK